MQEAFEILVAELKLAYKRGVAKLQPSQNYKPYHKRKLGSDAKLIIALLKEQPLEMDELCKRAGISLNTFFRIRPLLKKRGIIKETQKGYALFTYNEAEEQVIEAIDRLKNLAFRYPIIEEVAAEVAKTPEEAKRLIYKTVDRTGWFAPNKGIVESARERLGEVLVCAARIRDMKPSDLEKVYRNDPEILREARRFLEQNPEMLPRLSENVMKVISWPHEAIKYLKKPYEPKPRPALFFLSKR